MAAQEKEAHTHTKQLYQEHTPDSMSTEEETRTLPKWRILVVENDPLTRSDHVVNLERWGFQVFTAQGEGQALIDDAKRLAKKERCHLAVVDMRLLSDDDPSDTSGLDLVRHLKPTESIVVTGFANEPVYPRIAAEKGALAVFGKQEGPQPLQYAVRNELSKLGNPYPEPENLEKYKTSHAWRVLIVDNDAQERLYYVGLLQEWGYQIYEASSTDAEQKAKNHRCHLALVDTDANTRGLDMIQGLKPAEVIVMGASLTPEAWRSTAPEKGAIEVFNKREGAEKLGAMIQGVLSKCGYRDMNIEWPPELSETRVANHLFPNNPALFEDEASDVLRRLFKSASSLRIILLDSENNTPSLTLRPRSLVVRLKQDDHTRSHFVKIGRRMKAEQEVKNFKAVFPFFSANPYIEPTSAPFTFWNLGGAVYDFSGDYVQLRPKLFSKYYGSKNSRDIRKALENLQELWKPLYSDRKKTGEIRLLKAYCEVWGTDWLDDLRSYAGTNSSIRIPAEVSVLKDLPDPIAWLIGKVFDYDEQYRDSKTPLTQVAKTHGDLHGDNFFVTKDHVVWPIDFERTGTGPILQDWIELEHDILTRLLPFESAEWLLFGRLVSTIARPNEVHGWNRGIDGLLSDRFNHSQIDKAMEVIDKIRDLAKQSDGSLTVDAQPYIWGLLLNSVFRLMIWSKEDKEYEKPLSQKDTKKFKVRKEKLRLGTQRCLVLAAILCHRLEHWEDEEWPPQEWHPYLTGAAIAAQKNNSVHTPISKPQMLDVYNCALVIGVGNTPNDPSSSLPTTVNDALALQPILVDPMTCAYPPENVRILSNETASLPRIRTELQWLADQTTANPNSTAIVYFSGHGGHLQADGRYFLVPSSFNPTDIEGSVLWASEFTQRLKDIKAKRVLVLIDACHAAGIAGAKETSLLRASGFIETPPPEDLLKSWQQSQPTGSTKQATFTPPQGEGRAIISSSRGDQPSYIRKDGALSIFTNHLLEALRGEANKPDDTSVTVSTLIGHLGKTVPASAKRDWDASQEPWTEFIGEDFPVALIGRGHKGPAISAPEVDPPTNSTSSATKNHPVTLFYSYSHKDEKLRDRLEKHLSILGRQGVISNWHDRRITSGDEWKGAIDEHLGSAEIILLLVSADFLASDYCYDVELKRALERHEERTARVIPVILRSVDWTDAPFGKLQALPTDGKPVMEWNPSDKGFQNIARGIRAVVEQIRADNRPRNLS